MPRQTALISGGSRGIGAAIAKLFASNGLDVAITYNQAQDRAHELVRELAASCAVRCVAIQCDVRDPEAAKRAVEYAYGHFGALNVLVNNAGISLDQSIVAMTPDEWRSVTSTNLDGVFNFTRAAVTGFLRQRHGTIINVSSVAGLKGIAGMSNYAASKAGILGFTRSLAAECAPRNVTVNALAPGFIETDMVRTLSDKYREALLQKIPMRRFGTAEEVASMALYLTSDLARYITGQVFVMDGGLSV